MTDSSDQPILDYAPPRRRNDSWLSKLFRWLCWFTLKRPTSVDEAITTVWVILCVIWFWFIVGGSYPGPFEYEMPRLLILYLRLTSRSVIVMLGGLLFHRNWRVLRKRLAIVLISGVATGRLQFTTCPHATYLQIGAVSIAVKGERCGNYRHMRPWWMN